MNKILTLLIELQELTRQSQRGVDGVTEQIVRVRTKLSETHLRRFDHVSGRGRLAVALVSESGACGNCHMRLPPAGARHVRESAAELHTCVHCGCFLYARPMVNETKPENSKVPARPIIASKGKR